MTTVGGVDEFALPDGLQLVTFHEGAGVMESDVDVPIKQILSQEAQGQSAFRFLGALS
jgi:hypothetical protein